MRIVWFGGEKAPVVGASKKTEEPLMELITAYDLDELTLDELYALYHRLHYWRGPRRRAATAVPGEAVVSLTGKPAGSWA